MRVHTMALVIVLLLVYVASSGLISSAADMFDVTKNGAVGDGITDDSQAFLKAWNLTCQAKGTSTLYVPAGKKFFLSPLSFVGPCQSSSIQIQIDGDIVAPSSQDAWKNCVANTWIHIEKVNGLIVKGTGIINAMGASWWKLEARDRPNALPPTACFKPPTLHLFSCNMTQIAGLTFKDSGGIHIAINDCNDLSINKINITAPKDSHNTDGINLIRSSKVQIRDSNIGTGDDCIAINNNVKNVNISGVTCGPGHGISIGSLGDDGVAAVEGIYVENCNFTETMASLRIKTYKEAAGYARNIHYGHIILNQVDSAIEINQNYHELQQSSGLEVSEIYFTDVKGSGEKILLDCDQDTPCQKIHLKDVSIIPPEGRKLTVVCNHVNLESVNITPPLSCII